MEKIQLVLDFQLSGLSNKLLGKVLIFALTFYFLLFTFHSHAQGVGINSTGTAADGSAMLDVSSTTQGILIPRMTDLQRQTLKDPATGLIIYNLSTNEINFWNGTGWQGLSKDSLSGVSAGGTGPGEGTGINFSGQPAVPSAILDVSATDKGLLIPRTTQGQVTALMGLIIYNTSTNQINYYDGSSWQVPCSQIIDNNKGTGATTGGVAINSSGLPADPSAMLDVSSGTQGLLIPRMTSAQRNAVKTPAQGLIVYVTNDNSIEHWSGSAWYEWVYNVPATPGVITGNNSVCGNATGVTYSISAVTSATSYIWSVPSDATFIGQGTTSITVTFGTASGNVSVTAINACGESVAGTLAVTLNNLPVSVNIVPSTPAMICPGTSITFTATSANGGNNPSYHWEVNGSIVGTNSAYSYIPADKDSIICILTSNAICATGNPAISNTIYETVTTPIIVEVSIAAQPFQPICSGTSVTFTAVSTTIGSSPSYQWQVNGADVGGNSSIYTYTPASNNAVSCILTSGADLSCATGNPATSNTITETMNSQLTAGIISSNQTICGGATPAALTFTTMPSGGTGSYKYHWYNGSGSLGLLATNSTYSPGVLPVTTTVTTESFEEATFPPTGWDTTAIMNADGFSNWYPFSGGCWCVCSVTAHSGNRIVLYDACEAEAGDEAILVSPSFTEIGNTSGAAVSFWMYGDNGSTIPDSLYVWYSTNPTQPTSISNASLLGKVGRYNASTDWYLHSYTIPGSVRSSTVWLIFDAHSAGGEEMYIDDVSWDAIGSLPYYCKVTSGTCGTVTTDTVTITVNATCPCTWNDSYSFSDTRDNQIYSQVQIGSQCWMTQNLNYGTYTQAANTPQQEGYKFCQSLSVTDDPACPMGGLYEWANLMNGSGSCNGTCTSGDGLCDGQGDQQACASPVQGLCPNGWHIPSHFEWRLLEQTVCAQSPAGTNCTTNFPYNLTQGWHGTTEGTKLKSITGWNTGSGYIAGTNSCGFNAIGGGHSYQPAWQYNDPGINGLWRSSTEYDASSAWYWQVGYNEAGVLDNYSYYSSKSMGYSVRCIKN